MFSSVVIWNAKLINGNNGMKKKTNMILVEASLWRFIGTKIVKLGIIIIIKKNNQNRFLTLTTASNILHRLGFSTLCPDASFIEKLVDFTCLNSENLYQAHLRWFSEFLSPFCSLEEKRNIQENEIMNNHWQDSGSLGIIQNIYVRRYSNFSEKDWYHPTSILI